MPVFKRQFNDDLDDADDRKLLMAMVYLFTAVVFGKLIFDNYLFNNSLSQTFHTFLLFFNFKFYYCSNHEYRNLIKFISHISLSCF